MLEDAPRPECDALLDRLYEISEHVIAPVLLRETKVELRRNASEAFNARVGWGHDRGYAVEIFDGYVAGLGRVLDRAFAHETIRDSMSTLSAAIFGSVVAPVHLQKLVRDCVVLFAMFHEFSHVTCGHFQLRSDHGLVSANGDAFCMDEVDDSLPLEVGERRDAMLLIKQIELEADAMAYDFLYACGYEILLLDDEFRAQLAAEHGPEPLPPEVDLAIAEVMLFAGAATCFLIEAFHTSHSVYPTPQARVLSLALQAAPRFVFQAADPPHGRVALDDALRTKLGDFAARALNALEFGEACFEAVRGERRSPDEKQRPVEVALAHDLVGLMLESEVSTAAANELKSLIAGRAAFEAASSRYRIGVLGSSKKGAAHA